MLIDFLDFAGTAAFALSGAISALKKRMDLGGILVIAFAVGNGGGSIRDALLGRTPVFWMHQTAYIWATLIPALLLTAWLAPQKGSPYRKYFEKGIIYTDAFGLGLFAIVGTHIALLMGVSKLAAVLCGVITCLGGGFIRDFLCAQVPLIFHGELYAFPVVIGAGVYTLLYQHVNASLLLWACVLLTTGIRLVAIIWNIRIPIYSLD